jgi:AmmeMemoRadiSam system protein B
MQQVIRRSAVAGTWYPGDPKALRGAIEGYFRNVPDLAIRGEVIGLVAPHAGYIYSGQVAAYAYKAIRGKAYDAVIVISPSHRYHFHGVSLFHGSGYETPLGVIPVDEDRSERLLAASPLVSSLPEAHAGEHALEIQLPFLQVALGSFTLVPLVMGSQDRQTCEELARAIHRTAGPNVLIVGSSDLSHFHRYDEAIRLDKIVLDHLTKMDAPGLLRDLSVGRCEACGGGPAATTLMAAIKRGAGQVEILRYANSGDVTGDRGNVVGYAAAAFLRDQTQVQRENEPSPWN